MFPKSTSLCRAALQLPPVLRSNKLTLVMLALFLLLLTSGANAETPSVSLSTDQVEYLPSDTVIFTGTGYASGEVVTIEIRDAEGTVYDQWSVIALADGSISTTWILTTDSYQKDTLVASGAGDPSGLEASTSFILAPPAVSLEQMRNGSASSPDSPIFWVNGNAGASNSHLLENWSQAYRGVFTDLTAGDTVEFVVGYDITHSGKHAMDYLTYYDRINDPTHTSLYGHAQETINPLAGVGALSGPVYAAIPPPPLSSCTLVVPNPPGPPQLQPCTSFDNLDNDPTQVRMTLYGGTFFGGSPVSYDVAGDPTQAQSEARVRIKFVTLGPTAVLLWGGHLASNSDWGAGNSAGGISGSPYHNRAIELRINGSVRNVGNQDRSLSAAAVAPCQIELTCPSNITISCDQSTDPSNTGTPSYTANSECGTVSLSHSDSVTGTCPVVIYRRWVATGSGGRETCIQIITVVDTTKPVLIGCPANTTVQCNAIPAPPTVTATDNCDPSVVPVFSQISSLNGCGGYTGTITRKWVATDDCGNKDSCVQIIQVIDNSNPVCNIPSGPYTFFQCTPSQVLIPVSASDNCDVSVACAVVAGPGAVAGGNWTYTPSGDESFSVTIRCTDDCGNYCESSFNVTFVINDAPTCSPIADTTYTQCAPAQVCRPYSSTDPNGNLQGCTIISGPGALSGGNWCYTPSDDETVNVTIRCEDSCGASCDESFTVVFLVNDPPVINLGNDISLAQTIPQDTICFTYTISDPDGLAGLIENLVSSPAGSTFDTSINEICFVPPGTGTYEFIVNVTDPCGLSDHDTLYVLIAATQPPVCQLPEDTSFLQCTPAQVCLPVSATSLHGPVVCSVTSGPGTVSGGQWCYTPSGDENVNVTITCTDTLGVTCSGSFAVSFAINDAPICSPVSDTSYFQCVPTEVCRPFSSTDPNGNLTGCSIISGPGTLSGGNWCYTPTGDETVNVTIRCEDACGLFCEESFSVTFAINDAPICSPVSDTSYFQCVPAEVCRPFSSTDPNGNLTGCTIISGPGTLSGGNWCYTPSGDETVNVTIRCEDACGAFCEESFSVTFDVNDAPICSSIDDATIFQCAAAEVCYPFSSSDADGNLVGCSIVNGPGTLSGGNWCYTPSGNETVNVTIRCEDACGAFCEESFSLTFMIGMPPQITCAPDAAYDCAAQVPACSPADVTVVGGSGTVNVTCSSSNNGGSGCPGNTLIYTYTYTATDSCGLQSQCVRTITVLDSVGPVLSGCPSNVTIACNTPLPPPANVSATDNCDQSPTIQLVETPNYNGCGGNTGTVTRVWTATDDCGNATSCMQVITIQDSQPPTCNIPSGPFNYFQCAPGLISVPVSSTDNCDASVTCSVVSGPGAIVGGNWEYTPVGDASFSVTVRCTDDCGNSCEGTFNVNLDVNDPPTIGFGPDLSVFQCVPAQICVPYVVSDPNGLAGSVESLVSGPAGAVLNAALNQVCFTPAASGSYSIIARITDTCGASDQDTINVNVALNLPPTIAFGPDLSVFQCVPAPICVGYSASDPNGNALTGTLLSGPAGAALDQAGNQVCFTPASSGNYSIIVRVQDTCNNADVDTINVVVSLNLPPLAIGPNDTSVTMCSPAQICLPVSGVDPEGRPITITKISGPGTVAAGQWCYTPAGDEVANVTIRVTDSCGAYDDESFAVTFDVNSAPVCQVPNDTTIIVACSLRTISLPVSAIDPEGDLTECLVVNGPGSIENGFWTFVPPSAGNYCVTVQCIDECGATCQDAFCISIIINDEDCCLFKVSVNEGAPIPALNGQIVTVPVKFDLTGVPIGGFDLLLCYDATAITLVDVDQGAAIEAWEYFTYRLGVNGNCSNGNCPDGIVRLVGIAELNNGIPVGDPNAFLPIGSVADLSFAVTSDRNFINQCIPIRFCWFDCTDNTISSQSGDTTFLEITFNYEQCQSNPKGDPIPAICFEEGSICIQEPPDDRGDINLNGIANEVGDAVLFTNYFIYGTSVWDPAWTEVQILATDINDDGIVLTVADLIYLIRIITGDEQPFPPGTGTGSPKLSPYLSSGLAIVSVSDENITISTSSAVEIGGALFVFRYGNMSVGAPTLLDGAQGMNVRSHAEAGELRVLVYPSWDGEWATVGAGQQEILMIPSAGEGSIELAEVQMSDVHGALLSSSVAKAVVPSEYALMQNYPNPFNSGTVIGFDLKDASEWTVAIYNVLGQTVRTFEGAADASSVRLTWDGRDRDGSEVASGVYFYRVITPKWDATRTMTLIR